jgi:hypothetical protein
MSEIYNFDDPGQYARIMENLESRFPLRRQSSIPTFNLSENDYAKLTPTEKRAIMKYNSDILESHEELSKEPSASDTAAFNMRREYSAYGDDSHDSDAAFDTQRENSAYGNDSYSTFDIQRENSAYGDDGNAVFNMQREYSAYGDDGDGHGDGDGNAAFNMRRENSVYDDRDTSKGGRRRKSKKRGTKKRRSSRKRRSTRRH